VVEHQGMIWIWAGNGEIDHNKLPNMDILQQEGVIYFDTITDLPADYTYLIENGVDPAHVPISHDGTELGAKRANAQPLEMEIIGVSNQGFQGQLRRQNNPHAPWMLFNYIAPYLVLYDFNLSQFGKIGGLIAYFVPLGKNKTRVFVRRYGKNFFSRWFTIQPRWLEHIRQNKILEEDLFFIISEANYIEHSGKTLKDVFLPLKTVDVFVLEYRKWLDKYGFNLPSYDGYTTAKRPANLSDNLMTFDRLSRHTQLCSSCNQAHKNTQKAQKISLAIAIILAAITLLLDSFPLKLTTVSLSLLAIIIMVLARQLQTKFEYIYKR
ncbi:MAG TPA: aromatic ring-hydroxylating dioxygenase subunit alpha, partial [Allocoleopsis sp.]